MPFRKSSRLGSFAGIVVGAAAAYWCMLVVATHWPGQIPGLDNGWADKVAHFFAYCCLAIALASAWRVLSGRLSTAALVTLVLLISIYGAIDELTQALPMINRTCSRWDWLADVCGATVGAVFFAGAINARSRAESGEAVAATR